MKDERALGRAAGLTLLAAPLLLQIPYAVLAATFEYPGILRFPPEEILRRFAAGPPLLTPAWYLFGGMLLPLLLAMAALPEVLAVPRPKLLRVATAAGIASAVLQMTGLLRWVFLVPLLAKRHAAAASEPVRAAVVEVFLAQHQLLGVMIGEHLGQITLALWTLGVTLSIETRTLAARASSALGIAAGTLFLIGSPEGLATTYPGLAVLGPLPGIAFLLWTAWCASLGWRVYRAAR